MKTMKWIKVLAVLMAVSVLGVSIVGAREEVVAQGMMDSDEIMMDDEGEELEEMMMEEGEETEVEEVSYYLPYPGLLPDHFLYPVKMMRDRLVEWFTFEKVNKAELLLLYADKRLGASKVLLEGSKEKTGVETGRKTVVYQERVVKIVEELRSEGKEVGDLANRLERSTAKHAEVWRELVDSGVSEEVKPRMDEYKDEADGLNKRMQKVLGRE